MRNSYFGCLLLALGLLVCPISAQETGPSYPDVIIQRFLEKAEADSKYIGDNYTHYEREFTTDFKDGIVSKRREEYYFVEKRTDRDRPGLYKTLVLLDGFRPEKQREEFKEETFSISEEFLSRYEFAFISEAALGESGCWLFSFRSKSGHPENNKEDRIFNNLVGRVWIEKGTYNFKKLVFRLARHVDFAVPSFAGVKIKKVEGVVGATVIEGRFAISFAEVEYRYSARAFFFPIDGHSKKVIHYENYKRRGEQ